MFYISPLYVARGSVKLYTLSLKVLITATCVSKNCCFCKDSQLLVVRSLESLNSASMIRMNHSRKLSFIDFPDLHKQ
jgi:hypothetical protein